MSRATSEFSAASFKSFIFEDIDVVVDSPIAKVPVGNKGRSVTIISPNKGGAASSSAGSALDLENMTPFKRSEAITPTSILRSGRSSRASAAASSAPQQPPSAANFRVTHTSQAAGGSGAAPLPTATTMDKHRPAPIQPLAARREPATPSARRSRAASEISDYAVTPFVTRVRLEQQEKRQREADEAAAIAAAAAATNKAAAREAKAAAAVSSQRHVSKAKHPKPASSDDDDDERQSPAGRPTNPAVRALRSAMNLNVETPAAWKGRGGETPAPRTTLERQADEILMRQPNMEEDDDEVATTRPVPKSARKSAATNNNSNKAPSKAKPVPKAAAVGNRRRAREPSDDDEGDHGVGNVGDDNDDASSQGSHDIAPPKRAARSGHNAPNAVAAAAGRQQVSTRAEPQAQQSNKNDAKPRRRLTGTRQSLPPAADVDAALLNERRATATESRGRHTGGATGRSAESTARRAKSKSLEPLILRRRTSGAIVVADDSTPMSDHGGDAESDNDEEEISPLGRQRQRAQQSSTAVAAAPALTVPKTKGGTKATKATAAPAAGKKSAGSARATAAPIANSRAARNQSAKDKRQQSVTFATSHQAFSPADYSDDDHGDYDDDDATSVMTEDVIDTATAAADLRYRYAANRGGHPIQRQRAGNSSHHEVADRLEQLASRAPMVPFAAMSSSFRNAVASHGQHQSGIYSAARATSSSVGRATASFIPPQMPTSRDASPVRQRRGRGGAPSASAAAGNNPMAAFFQAAFPQAVALPPNLDSFRPGGGRGMRLPLAINNRRTRAV
jgi:hypothetical protein